MKFTRSEGLINFWKFEKSETHRMHSNVMDEELGSLKLLKLKYRMGRPK